LILLMCYSVAFTSSMDRFEGHESSAPIIGIAARYLTDLLMMPANYFLSFYDGNFPNSIEWVVFVFNSFLGGFLFAFIYLRNGGHPSARRED